MEQYSVTWSKIAGDDLKSIINYISKDSPTNARNVLARIKKASFLLYTYPARGRVVPELKELNIQQYRELILDPWRIIYKISKSTVIVMSVIDARRNVEDILFDRLIAG